MQTRLITSLLILINLTVVSCKTSAEQYSEKGFPKFFGNELDFLSSYKTSEEIESKKSILIYKELNLKTVIKNRIQEFWIGDSLIYSIPKKLKEKCRVIEVFKKSFILISHGSCGIATPDFVERNNVALIDLNSRKVYSFSLGDLFLTRSIEMSEIGYPNSNKYFGILNIDLDDKKINIHNKFYGTLKFNLVTK